MSRVEPRENFPRRRIPSQNIVHKLIRRELCGELKPGTSFRNIRSFHTSVVPDFTIINVEKPPCFLRKFSPDGRYVMLVFLSLKFNIFFFFVKLRKSGKKQI